MAITISVPLLSFSASIMNYPSIGQTHFVFTSEAHKSCLVIHTPPFWKLVTTIVSAFQRIIMECGFNSGYGDPSHFTKSSFRSSGVPGNDIVHLSGVFTPHMTVIDSPVMNWSMQTRDPIRLIRFTRSGSIVMGPKRIFMGFSRALGRSEIPWTPKLIGDYKRSLGGIRSTQPTVCRLFFSEFCGYVPLVKNQ